MRVLMSILQQFQKPPMSLKQFMLRAEIDIHFRRLSRLMETPPSSSSTSCTTSLSKGLPGQGTSPDRRLDPLQVEWVNWVRAEFRLRQNTNDEEAVKMMLAHGKRQLQEIERTILLATNRNSKETSETSPTTNSFEESNEKHGKHISCTRKTE